MLFASHNDWLSIFYFTDFLYYYGESYPFLALVLKKKCIFAPVNRRELSCDAKKAFVLVHYLKFAKF